MNHEATIYTTGRHGCWWTCACGAESTVLHRSAGGASIDWSQHLAATTCPAHGPLTDDGGCAGCVADDRATDAWEGN